MKTLVTGATGLLGNNVVRQLVQQGADVRALTRPSSDRRPLEGLAVETVHADLSQVDELRQACRDVHTIIHAAGHVEIGWSRPELYEQVNVQGTVNLLAAARQAGARLVYVSTVNTLGLGAWKQPADEDSALPGIVPCPYVESKRRAEEQVLEAARQQHAVVVNPAFMLGPWDWKPSSGRMLLEVTRRFVPVAPSGGCTVCDARDVAHGVLLAAEQGRSGRRYILGGQCMSYLKIWRLFQRLARRSGPWIITGPLLPMLAGWTADQWGRLTGREPAANSAAIRITRQAHYFTSRRAEQELGYRCRPFEQTAQDTWQWFRDFGYR